ncbi:MAG: sugar phosphate isomerase/epimerase [Ruminococcaceae bacterium]|nr:sugar phosphate isomerase/epimerase [Oscillospiraceae bacterium]
MDKRIGAQLYTARDFLKTNEDFYKSMKKISEIGYKQVQASGVGISDAPYIRRVCDEFGLEITCTHRPLDNYINKLDEEIAYHKALGCKIAGLGGMPPEFRCEEKIMEFIEIMNGIHGKLKKEGLVLTYHNHSFEFIKYNGRFMMDYLIEYGKFSFIVDTYWLAYAGINPADYIRKLGERTICVHYKDLAMADAKEVKMAPVGSGNLDWDKINLACEDAGVKYALVEQDICEEDPFLCLKKSYDFLSEKGFN